MVLFAAWIKKAVARFQQRTDEWSRKRIEENAIGNLERERIRSVLLLGTARPDKAGRQNLQDIAAQSPMTDFFLRE